MKKLSEMKAYFQDLFESCQLAGGFEKSIFDCTERARFEMFCETLGFIYGDAFKDIRPTWTQEALEHFYSGITICSALKCARNAGTKKWSMQKASQNAQTAGTRWHPVPSANRAITAPAFMGAMEQKMMVTKR